MNVAIIGRPNTGKSSLFNCLIRKKKAVIDDLPGVTRDRLSALLTYNNKTFNLIDTGGYDPGDDLILRHILEQINIAINDADLLLFVVDVKAGILPFDYELSNIIRKSKKKTILVVNKVDNENIVYNDFYSLGFPLIPISVAHKRGIGDLLDLVSENLPNERLTLDRDNRINIAISGRLNTGKSTLLNSIINDTRAVVNDKPGTTRDTIDVNFSNEFGDFTIVDTAGIRKKAKTESRIEFFSIMRAKKAIEKANLALLVIDGSIGITTQDKKVSEIIQELGVSCIVVVNKKDQMKKDFKDELYKINYLSYAPTIYISALYDRDYKKLFKLIKEVISERNKKISTGELNRFFQDLINYKTPPLSGNKEINLKYIVQANTYNGAVRFIIFTNYPKDVHKSYERFIINRIRGEYSFIGSPIEIVFKKG